MAVPAYSETVPPSQGGPAASSFGQETPEGLLALLKHPSPARRGDALVRIADRQPSPQLLKTHVLPLLKDPDPLVRGQAARAIWLCGNRPDLAVATLRELLDPAHPQACALASFLLGEIGPGGRDALSALRDRMTESDPLLRLHAAEAIAKIEPSDPAAHLVLAQALHDPLADVRYFAACALLTAGAPFRDQIRGALLETLADDDLRVASAAALSLENWSQATSADSRARRAEAASSPQLARLAGGLADPNIAVRRRAALRLAELEQGAVPLARQLREGLRDDDPLVRAYSALALWRAGNQAAVVLPVLIDQLGTTHPNVTTLATTILAQLGPSAADALPTLYDLLETSDPVVRLHVAIAISRIDPRGRDAIAVLSTAARSGDSDLRYLATLSLGHVSLPLRKLAERELTAALTDRNLRVRAAALLALRQLQSAYERARDNGETGPVSQLAAERLAQALPGEADLPDSETIPVLDERPVPNDAAPRAGHGSEFDVDDVTVEEKKSIAELRARITPPEGDLPIDHAGPLFAMEGAYYHGYGMARGWNGSAFAWANTGLCYQPLYFQDLNLERYGYHYGCFQTVVSTVRFAADAALLPYKVVVEPPCDCVYTLGYDRPGNCVPYRCYRLPWRTDAALVLGGVAVGLIFLAPP